MQPLRDPESGWSQLVGYSAPISGVPEIGF
jgi:hypothetical protein